jgi:hypothetical protein
MLVPWAANCSPPCGLKRELWSGGITANWVADHG